MQTNGLRLKMMHQYFVGSNVIGDVQGLRGHEGDVKLFYFFMFRIKNVNIEARRWTLTVKTVST